MTKNEEKRERKERFMRQVREAMREKNVTPRDIELATGLPYHAVNDAIHKGASARTDNIQRVADCLEMDISWLPVSTVKPPVEGRRTPVVKPSTGKTPAIGKAKVTWKEINDGRYIVTTKGETFERTEIKTKEEVEGMEAKTEQEAQAEAVQMPTMTDDSQELKLNEEEPCIWVDGRKYTKADIERMLEEGVAMHRDHVELDSAFDEACEKIKAYEADLKELTDKYIIRDKEAIKWQVEAEELREELSEKKESSALENMTIGDAVKHYRALKRILRDEVLQ